MTWQGIRGHDAIVEHFRKMIRGGRFASSYLFIGKSGIGKRLFARKLAQALLCDTNDEYVLDPCGKCASCQQVLAETHPDVIRIARPPDKTVIPLEMFIGPKENRMREGLCHDIALKPFRGRRKIAIIEDADDFNVEGANSLLKTLEEPPTDSVLILIGTSEQMQLPTIRSRCQTVRFQPLTDDDIATILTSNGIITNPQEAAGLASLAQGSIDRAVEFADPHLRDIRETVLIQMSNPPWQPVELNTAVTSYVDAAGKELIHRRPRLKNVIGFAIEFYRELMLSITGGGGVATDRVLSAAVRGIRGDWKWGQIGVAACLDHCVDCIGYIESNATPQTIIEYWLDELALISRTGRPTPIAERLVLSNY